MSFAFSIKKKVIIKKVEEDSDDEDEGHVSKKVKTDGALVALVAFSARCRFLALSLQNQTSPDSGPISSQLHTSCC